MSFDPTIGRWIEADPAGYIDGPNEYQMERGDPTGLTDPLGTDAMSPADNPALLGGGTVPYTPAMGRSPRSTPPSSGLGTLDSALDGLDHYLNGNGATASLSDSKINDLKKYYWYQHLIQDTIPQKVKAQLPTKPGQAKRQVTLTGDFEGNGGPWQTDIDTGGWGKEPNWSFDLNNLLGTPHGSWTATADVASTEADSSGKFTSYSNIIKVHITLEKVYTFRNWANAPFYVAFDLIGRGKPYKIHNEWDDSAPAVSVEHCLGQPDKRPTPPPPPPEVPGPPWSRYQIPLGV